MTEEDFSANIDWNKNKKISSDTRESRKIDIQKASLSEKKDRNKFSEPIIKTLSPNLKKLRKKIKDVYDDDDEDENEEIVFFFGPEENSSSLMNALKEEEKLQLKFQNTIENQKLQETAGKMEAIATAQKISKSLGIPPLEKKLLNQKAADASLSDETFNDVLTENINKKSDIKVKNINFQKELSSVGGIKAVASKINVNGKEDEKKGFFSSWFSKKEEKDPVDKVAKTILKKTGRLPEDSKKKKTNKSKEMLKNKKQKKNLNKEKSR